MSDDWITASSSSSSSLSDSTTLSIGSDNIIDITFSYYYDRGIFPQTLNDETILMPPNQHRPNGIFSPLPRAPRMQRRNTASNAQRHLQMRTDQRCRFFASGTCKYGNLCRYSHSPYYTTGNSNRHGGNRHQRGAIGGAANRHQNGGDRYYSNNNNSSQNNNNGPTPMSTCTSSSTSYIAPAATAALSSSATDGGTSTGTGETTAATGGSVGTSVNWAMAPEFVPKTNLLENDNSHRHHNHHHHNNNNNNNNNNNSENGGIDNGSGAAENKKRKSVDVNNSKKNKSDGNVEGGDGGCGGTGDSGGCGGSGGSGSSGGSGGSGGGYDDGACYIANSIRSQNSINNSSTVENKYENNESDDDICGDMNDDALSDSSSSVDGARALPIKSKKKSPSASSSAGAATAAAITNYDFCNMIADPKTKRCPNGDTCEKAHGDLCNKCHRFWLITDTVSSSVVQHINVCQSNDYVSQRVEQSKDKTCGICFENVIDKEAPERRFGILPNCNHIFCLACIRKWRQSKQFENRIIRSCPECRTSSDFVCPSLYWFDSNDEKQKLIADYKNALNQKGCKYFKQGDGKCPFGNKCFYKHALANGVQVDVGLPQRRVRRYNNLDDLDFIQQLFLHEFLGDRESSRWIDEWDTISTDSAESDVFTDFDILESFGDSSQVYQKVSLSRRHLYSICGCEYSNVSMV